MMLGMLLFIALSVEARTLIFQSGSNDSAAKTTSASVSAENSSLAPLSSSASQNTSVTDDASYGVSLPNSANSELFFMIEQLQQEVNTLRGTIEEQGHELRMLKQSSRDRYVDIDSRVLDLTKRVSDLAGNSLQVPQTAAQLNTSSTPAPQNSAASGVSNAPVTTKAAIVVRDPTKAENDAYNDAYALIKEKKFDDAILSLFSYTENFPDSPLLPNVYYWLGEVYLATSKLEQAKTSFTFVITAYPDSPKASDTLYKLAVTLDRLGQKQEAEQYLAEVLQKFPESSAAKLAAAYKLNP